MGKKKAELEVDYSRHRAMMQEVREAHGRRDYQQAVKLAVSAWDFIDGMMQYERKYSDRAEYNSIASIDYVLRHAPLLFDFDSLDKLAALLKSQRRIEKNTATDIAQKLADAKSLMMDAHRLWNHLESDGECRQDRLRSDLGGDQDRWRGIVETWEQMGLVHRATDGGSYRLTLSTHLDRQGRGKCPSCGVTGRATMARLLEEINCPNCQAAVYFVLYSSRFLGIAL